MGGLLAAKHVADYSDTPALVLMSAHMGGKNVVPVASRNGLFGRDKLPELIDEAERRIADGKGDDLMLMPGWYWVTTAQSFLDYANNLPHLLKQAPKITCPVLFIRGDQEPAELYPAEEFRELCKGPVEIAVIENCNHFYEEQINEIVCSWIEEVLR